jgi:hypothetical protein
MTGRAISAEGMSVSRTKAVQMKSLTKLLSKALIFALPIVKRPSAITSSYPLPS